jgi:hypothetical protein
MIGKKFGRLTVLERTTDAVHPNGKRSIQYICECECSPSKRVIVYGENLRNNNTQSCGCLHKERTSSAKKSYNKYDLSGEYGIGYTNKKEEFYFDLTDYELIKNYCWMKNDQRYIVTREKTSKKNIRQHRLIMNVLDKNEIQIDHANNKRFDNRKFNLRFANKQQNQANRMANSNNKLGEKGVQEINGKYVARISFDKKEFNLGSFENIEDAINARYEKELELYGEFAYKKERNE